MKKKGFIEVCIMHPLDLIKTRLQLQIKTSKVSQPNVVSISIQKIIETFLLCFTLMFFLTFSSTFKVYYNGVFDCAAKMMKNEGLFSLYKGIVPPILVETPKRAVKFLTFEQLKPLFLFGNEKPTPLVSNKKKG